MRELSLHILDVVENGITAGGNCIWIEIDEARKKDLLKIVIRDNGRGMPVEKLKNIVPVSLGPPISQNIAGLGFEHPPVSKICSQIVFQHGFTHPTQQIIQAIKFRYQVKKVCFGLVVKTRISGHQP